MQFDKVYLKNINKSSRNLCVQKCAPEKAICNNYIPHKTPNKTIADACLWSYQIQKCVL